MASSNVEYYEKQKQLQDIMTSCEQERMDLNRQLRIALQADQTSSKMKAARLHSYWKKICEDEKKAKQRNEMLAREFQRIDAHMSDMNSRTMRLAHMKKQYEDYIARTYPEWNELMYGRPQSQSYNEESQQKHQERVSQHVSDVNTSHQSLHQEQQNASQQQSHTEPKHLSSLEPVTPRAYSQPVEQNHSPSLQSMTPRVHSQPMEQNHPEENIQNVRNESLHYSPSVTQSKAHIDQHTSSEAGIYQNLPSARSDSEKHIATQNEGPHRNGEDSSFYQNEQSMSKPVQSVDIQSRSSGQRIQSSSFNHAMQPALEEEDEDEETSEFATESEIPMAQSLQNTQIRADSVGKKESHHSADDGVIKPELTIEGLLYLLNFMENDMAEAFSVEGYYRSSGPETALKNDIVRKANSHGDLRRIDANHISMVTLEQITLIVRSLSEKCLIPESLLQENFSTLTPTKLRLHLSSEAQIVWDALFGHFVKLVTAQVMEAPVLSAIFIPCLVVEGGSQDKAHTFIVQFLEGINGGLPPTLQQTNKSMSPAATMEGSGSFVEDGKVPRLKFGSLIDKPSSDDESSFINSLPRDPVPLNETAAYKSMVSTGESIKPKRQSSLQEDTDDDVEKQIATALSKQPVIHQSPRKRMEMEDPSETSSQTLQSTPHVYVPTALEPKSPRRPIINNLKKSHVGVKISSDLDTDTEVDATIFGSSRQPEDNFDFDFYD